MVFLLDKEIKQGQIASFHSQSLVISISIWGMYFILFDENTLFSFFKGYHKKWVTCGFAIGFNKSEKFQKSLRTYQK